MSQNPSNTKKILLTFAAIIAVGILLQQYFKNTAGDDSFTPPGSNTSIKKISVKTNTDDWETYTNEKLGFSAKYPKNASLRGHAESDLAIFTLSTKETSGKQSLITLTKKKVPLGKEVYASMEEFWEDEQRFIVANNGVVSDAQYVEINGRIF